MLGAHSQRRPIWDIQVSGMTDWSPWRRFEEVKLSHCARMIFPQKRAILKTQSSETLASEEVYFLPPFPPHFLHFHSSLKTQSCRRLSGYSSRHKAYRRGRSPVSELAAEPAANCYSCPTVNTLGLLWPPAVCTSFHSRVQREGVQSSNVRLRFISSWTGIQEGFLPNSTSFDVVCRLSALPKT